MQIARHSAVRLRYRLQLQPTHCSRGHSRMRKADILWLSWGQSCLYDDVFDLVEHTRMSSNWKLIWSPVTVVFLLPSVAYSNTRDAPVRTGNLSPYCYSMQHYYYSWRYAMELPSVEQRNPHAVTHYIEDWVEDFKFWCSIKKSMKKENRIVFFWLLVDHRCIRTWSIRHFQDLWYQFLLTNRR